MAIRYSQIEGVRLLVEVLPVIWSDQQRFPTVDIENLKELAANYGEGIIVDQNLHVFWFYDVWKLIVGCLVKFDYLISQRCHEIGCLISDDHFELEVIVGILLLAIG